MVSVSKVAKSTNSVSKMATRKIMRGCSDPSIYETNRWAPYLPHMVKFKKAMLEGLRYLK